MSLQKQIENTMKTFFKILVAAIVLSSFTHCTTEQKDIQLLKNFYTKYMKTFHTKNMDETIPQSEAETYLSPCLPEKLRLMSNMLRIDAVIGDTYPASSMEATLTITPIKKNWYKISYQNTFSNPNDITNIFAKVENNKITEIYPWQVDTNVIDTPYTPEKMSQANALSFVQSFYSNYLNIYFGCPDKLMQNLRAFQEKHCSPILFKRFKDINSEYDSLISSYYFDKDFLKTLKITQEGDYIYIAYKRPNNYSVKMKAEVIQLPDGTYKLNDITEVE
ncbi:hypothetical protein C4H12_08145 [Capnocytophaga sp. oral taxon 878]|nr:hypothetical protein C4H12_08145 [Capnocytophaga sp. oral taxon 878]